MNIGLNVVRQMRLQGGWKNAMVTNTLVEYGFNIGGSGAGYIFPLYLYPTQRAKKLLKNTSK
ncbi:hypothetical protein [Helicobacter sp. 13S00477-4]|uniref:hypothetical protein n=1 Tax=Helicobacter sp. 13S00477-4 TaxID=1905759 RepID=UPI002151A94E|nr:hypothetical protein [Helicobacter sp. 13S00477-4]